MNLEYVIIYKPFSNSFENMVVPTSVAKPRSKWPRLLLNAVVLTVRYLLI